ncbi:hypothetical protein D3C71_1794760 [compost metagenome]
MAFIAFDGAIYVEAIQSLVFCLINRLNECPESVQRAIPFDQTLSHIDVNLSGTASNHFICENQADLRVKLAPVFWGQICILYDLVRDFD